MNDTQSGDRDSRLFDLAGGETVLKAVIRTFYDAVFDDVMIGFFFRNADKERLIQKEYELAARMLGADIKYTGKPIRAAHAEHRIMGGQFMRRLQLLKNAMAHHELPQEVIDAWVADTERLRPQITAFKGGNCD